MTVRCLEAKKERQAAVEILPSCQHVRCVSSRPRYALSLLLNLATVSLYFRLFVWILTWICLVISLAPATAARETKGKASSKSPKISVAKSKSPAKKAPVKARSPSAKAKTPRTAVKSKSPAKVTKKASPSPKKKKPTKRTITPIASPNTIRFVPIKDLDDLYAGGAQGSGDEEDIVNFLFFS